MPVTYRIRREKRKKKKTGKNWALPDYVTAVELEEGRQCRSGPSLSGTRIRVAEVDNWVGMLIIDCLFFT